MLIRYIEHARDGESSSKTCAFVIIFTLHVHVLKVIFPSKQLTNTEAIQQVLSS